MREALALAKIARSGRRSACRRCRCARWTSDRRGYNSPVSLNDPTAHAEMIAIREAAMRAGNYRLVGSFPVRDYGALRHVCRSHRACRIETAVFAARDLRFGGVRSKFRLADSDLLNHQVDSHRGSLRGQSRSRCCKHFSPTRR